VRIDRMGEAILIEHAAWSGGRKGEIFQNLHADT